MKKLIILLLLISVNLSASTYYIKQYGSDYQNGLTLNTAFKTLKKALSVVKSGDSIYITKGTYYQEIVQRDSNFLSTVTISGEGNGETIFDGQKIKNYGIALSNCRNITINNIQFKNYKTSGIYVIFSSKIIVSNNKVYNCGFNSIENPPEGFGINAKYSDEVAINLNDVWNNGPSLSLQLKGYLGNGINTFALKNSNISYNISTKNIGGGLLVEDGINITVENNILSNNNSVAPLNSGGEWWCGGLWVDGGHNITIQNNKLQNNITGIYLSDLDGQEPYNYILKNNSSDGNDYGLFLIGLGKEPINSNVLKLDSNNINNNIKQNVYSNQKYSYVKTDIPVADKIFINYKEYKLTKSSIKDHQDWILIYTAQLGDNTNDYISIRQKYSKDSLNNIINLSSQLYIKIEISNYICEKYVDISVADTPINQDCKLENGKIRYSTFNFNTNFQIFEYDYFTNRYILINKGNIIFGTKP